MRYRIQAACGCHTGKKRTNNEDNFCFDGKHLELDNDGLEEPVSIEKKLKPGLQFAVFDGMGGENFGEYASYTTAQQLLQTTRKLSDRFISEEKYLRKLTQQLDDAVVRMQREMLTEKMGTTMVSLSFSGQRAFVCNVGDSRAYCLRDGEFIQLSTDHVEKRPGRESKKAPLTQYLGFGSEDILLKPHVVNCELKKGDMYLLCSDGLTDMLTDFEISDMMLHCENAEACVQALIQAALEHGGRDNITVIVCKLMGRE